MTEATYLNGSNPRDTTCCTVVGCGECSLVLEYVATGNDRQRTNPSLQLASSGVPLDGSLTRSNPRHAMPGLRPNDTRYARKKESCLIVSDCIGLSRLSPPKWRQMGGKAEPNSHGLSGLISQLSKPRDTDQHPGRAKR